MKKYYKDYLEICQELGQDGVGYSDFTIETYRNTKEDLKFIEDLEDFEE